MFRTFYKGYSDTHLERKLMDNRLKIALALAGVGVVAYAVGYHRAQARMVTEFGGAAAKEALIYLATQDHIRNRGR